MTSLPLQTGYCETIGVGRVTNTWSNGKGIVIAVDNYWRGDPGHDTLSILMATNQPPVSEEHMVFFLTKYKTSFSFGLGPHLYDYIFRPDLRNREEEVIHDELVFYDDKRSWFHVNDTNLVSFASNLVFSSQSYNTNLFYQTIRDGYRLNPEDSRIHDESFFAFLEVNCFSTNFIFEVLNDPLLVGHAQQIISNKYLRIIGEFYWKL